MPNPGFTVSFSNPEDKLLIGSLISCPINVQDVRLSRLVGVKTTDDTGRYAVAAEDIPTGIVLYSDTRHIIISKKNAAFFKYLGEILLSPSSPTMYLHELVFYCGGNKTPSPISLHLGICIINWLTIQSVAMID